METCKKKMEQVLALRVCLTEKAILNKVDMDLKQLKDELVSEFKAMFAKEVKLAEWKTEAWFYYIGD